MTRTGAPAATETQVLQQVLDALLLFGLDVDRQNTGGFYNDKGQFIRCGEPGNSDLTGMLTSGPGKGKKVDVEIKKPGFNPQKLRGGQREQARWDAQLARLRRTNAQGGYGFWVTSPEEAIATIERINQGWRVQIDDDGWPFVTDED